MEQVIEKRKKVSISKEEREILTWLFTRTLVPVMFIILVSSLVLFFGLEYLMKQVSFGNYGLSPALSTRTVTRFISTYSLIAIANILLMVSLSLIVTYIMLQNMVLPVLRITREMKECSDKKIKVILTVRKNDKLLMPLVEMINKLGN